MILAILVSLYRISECKCTKSETYPNTNYYLFSLSETKMSRIVQSGDWCCGGLVWAHRHAFLLGHACKQAPKMFMETAGDDTTNIFMLENS